MPFQSVNVLPVLPKPHNGLPRGPQLSAPEDKEMKKKLRNRESALAARERKKQKMLELERKVDELSKENDDLRSENSVLRGTLSSVMQKYGAPSDEIEETLRIAETKRAIKKEPGCVESSPDTKKPKPENKRPLLRAATQTAGPKVTVGPDKKCRKIIKQESNAAEALIKLPKVLSGTTKTTAKVKTTSLPTKGHLFLHKSPIQLTRPQLDPNVKQEPIEPVRRRISWESGDEKSSRYSPPWTPPDMSAMQNSPSSDSAYSTGSENGFNSVQFIPIQLPPDQANRNGLSEPFQQTETVTLYDTEITYDQRTTLPRTTTTPSTRVPRYHSYHELMGQNEQHNGEQQQQQQPRNSEWLNLLQSNNTELDKLKPEDFLNEPEQVKVEDKATNESATTDDKTDLFSDRGSQSFFQSQILNLDEVFGHEVFSQF